VTRPILIADADAKRAKRLAELCAERGFSIRTVSNGALALEAALAEVPDLIVAPCELELIDTPQLVEILRANPRTRGVRFVFLGERSPRSAAGDLEGEVVALPADGPEVVRCIEQVVAQRSRIDAFDAGHSESPLSGQLSQVELPDLLQLLHLNRRTGALELTQRERGGREKRGIIHLREGNVAQANVGAVEGEKALFRLLGWKTGSFAFAPTETPVDTRIETPTRALLMEGMRQLDEWESLQRSLPALDARVALRVTSSALPHMVHPLTQEVLLLLEMYTRVQEVVDSCSFPDYQVLRTLQTLIERGIVEIHWGPPELAVEENEVFPPGHVRRLREWLSAGRPPDAPLADAKLLLVGSQPSTGPEFLTLLRDLPGLELAARVADDRLGPHDFVEVARVPIDAEVGVRLLCLPARPIDAPLWPLASHGALAVVCLLTGPVAEASQAVRPVLEALRGLPRTRIFYVMLLHKKDRPLPEELRENLALIDDASLFLIPVEGAAESPSLVHGLFARVLP
jgi:CheY-like chemotaxis protein